MTDYYAANLQLFRQHFPDATLLMKEMGRPFASLMFENGLAVDIDLGAGRLYGVDARIFARQQLDAFFARPSRHLLNPPAKDFLADPLSLCMAEFIAARAGERGITICADPPISSEQPGAAGNYLVVIGVGLGLHLQELAERTGCKHVILVEPFAELLYHSLHAMDWQDLVKAKGKTFHLITNPSPEGVVEQIGEIIKAHGAPLLDGSYYYLHYNAPITNQIKAKYLELVGLSMILRGYFEDEVLMVKNAAANFKSQSFYLVDGLLRQPRIEPAFIVGSGPSIDDCMETIGKWQDRAIIFSAGTSAQALLHHGIRPDFHVEKENHQIIHPRMKALLNNHRQLFKHHKFDGVALIASATVVPELLDLFDQRLLFFRDSVSSTHIFGNGYHCIDGIGPCVANTALTMAAVLGFRDIYLFGCDCGARDEDRHHAMNTVYSTGERPKDAGRIKDPFLYPGNFGGKVLTNTHFAWSRGIIEQVIKQLALKAKNCSDGVMIEGATPTAPGAIRLGGGPIDKAAIASQIREASMLVNPGDLLQKSDALRLQGQWRKFNDDFKKALAKSRQDCQDIGEIYAQMRQFMDQAASGYGGVSSMVSGSALGLPMIAAYYLNRIEDPRQRSQIFGDFMAEFNRAMEEIDRHGTRLFAEL